jgi:hypothetical protein
VPSRLNVVREMYRAPSSSLALEASDDTSEPYRPAPPLDGAVGGIAGRSGLPPRHTGAPTVLPVGPCSFSGRPEYR